MVALLGNGSRPDTDGGEAAVGRSAVSPHFFDKKARYDLDRKVKYCYNKIVMI